MTDTDNLFAALDGAVDALLKALAHELSETISAGYSEDGGLSISADARVQMYADDETGEVGAVIYEGPKVGATVLRVRIEDGSIVKDLLDGPTAEAIRRA